MHSIRSDGLADILERVLDKGVVVAGDVSISLVGVELLTIKLRLIVASVDRAKELGIRWWEADPQLSPMANQLQEENRRLTERLAAMEAQLSTLTALASPNSALPSQPALGAPEAQ